MKLVESGKYRRVQLLLISYHESDSHLQFSYQVSAVLTPCQLLPCPKEAWSTVAMSKGGLVNCYHVQRRPGQLLPCSKEAVAPLSKSAVVYSCTMLPSHQRKLALYGCSEQQQQDMVRSDYFVEVNMVHMGTDNNSSNKQHVLVCVQQTTWCIWVQTTIAAIHSMYWYVCSGQHGAYGYRQQQQQYLACIGMCVVDNMVHMGTDNNSSNTQHVLVCVQCTANNKQVRKVYKCHGRPSTNQLTLDVVFHFSLTAQL